MMPDLGYAALVVAGLLTVYAIVAAMIGRRNAVYLESARASILGVVVLLTLAVGALEVALVTHDFSVRYVAEHNATTTPLVFSIAGLWGGLGGSILFWAWLLGGAVLAVAHGYRARTDLLPYVLAVLLGVLAFFLLVMLGPANPFARLLPPPIEGVGLNPLLQNHPLMLIHPPMLYLGFVGLAVPYAFAMASLLTGRARDEWPRLARRWMLGAWACLSVGIVLGAWWSYEVLGWGGYWAWDPVENASFMPWLTSTAMLHSVMVQEHRQMLRGWNLTLVTVTFLLTLFGTFLTRSGILTSVHAFSLSAIGPMFLAFIAVALAFSLVLLLRRPPGGEQAALDAYLSRESAFLMNNLLFVAFAFAVFAGTLFPLFAEALRGERLSVGPPFFNRVTTPIVLAILLLMGIAPMLPWRRARGDRLAREMLAPAGVAVAAGLGVLALDGRLVAAVPIAVVAFVLAATLQEFYLGAQARRAATGSGFARALADLFGRNRRRYGGYVVHLGVLLVALGVIGTSGFTLETERALRPGEALTIGRYTVRFDRMEAWQAPDKRVIAGRFTVLRGGRPIGVLRPASNYYPGRDAPIATPDVRTTPLEDLYLVLTTIEPEHATLRAMVQPLAYWIWTGGAVLLVGAVVAAWPARLGVR